MVTWQQTVPRSNRANGPVFCRSVLPALADTVRQPILLRQPASSFILIPTNNPQMLKRVFSVSLNEFLLSTTWSNGSPLSTSPSWTVRCDAWQPQIWSVGRRSCLWPSQEMIQSRGGLQRAGFEFCPIRAKKNTDALLEALYLSFIGSLVIQTRKWGRAA